MPRYLPLLFVVLGAVTILIAALGYLPLRDFMLNGTPTFNPNGHYVLGPVSVGLESALASSNPSGIMDAATYCVSLQRRLIGLALIGLTVLLFGFASARSTTDDKGRRNGIA